MQSCSAVELPEEDYQSIIETLQIKIFANYREVQDLSPTSLSTFLLNQKYFSVPTDPKRASQQCIIGTMDNAGSDRAIA